MTTEINKAIEVVRLNRLTPDQYRALEKKLAGISVTGTTTAHQAGYMLGIQQALAVIREGWAHEIS
jgi:hypothetical protein